MTQNNTRIPSAMHGLALLCERKEEPFEIVAQTRPNAVTLTEHPFDLPLRNEDDLEILFISSSSPTETVDHMIDQLREMISELGGEALTQLRVIEVRTSVASRVQKQLFFEVMAGPRGLVCGPCDEDGCYRLESILELLTVLHAYLLQTEYETISYKDALHFLPELKEKLMGERHRQAEIARIVHRSAFPNKGNDTKNGPKE